MKKVLPSIKLISNLSKKIRRFYLNKNAIKGEYSQNFPIDIL